jgi:hypothetical protein
MTVSKNDVKGYKIRTSDYYQNLVEWIDELILNMGDHESVTWFYGEQDCEYIPYLMSDYTIAGWCVEKIYNSDEDVWRLRFS